MGTKARGKHTSPHQKTPTFLLELPLVVEAGQPSRRCGSAMASLNMLFTSWRENCVSVGQARRVRFKSRGRGLSSIENKRTDTGLRFVLQTPEEGQSGSLIWHNDHLPALIEWDDPVVAHGLAHPVKYARLVRRPASSLRAQGADREGDRYVVQLVLAGTPYHKPSTWRARTPSAWIWVRPASPSCRSKPRPGSNRCARNCVPMREPSAGYSGAWSGSGAPPIPSTTTSGVGPESAAQVPKAGSRAGATR
jgi:hypothetical protein